MYEGNSQYSPVSNQRMQGLLRFRRCFPFQEVFGDGVIQQFEQYLVENGIAPKTIESYVGDVRAFADFLAPMGVDQPTDLKRFYAASYKNHLIERKYAVATINKKINSLQAYNLFLIERKLATELVVTLKKNRIKVAAGSEQRTVRHSVV